MTIDSRDFPDPPRRIITISYTGLHAGGGVPKFNRDIHAAFPERIRRHFCWEDFPWHIEIDARGETEWGRARILNEYLVRNKMITEDDVVIADGFWAAGLEHLPFAVSHSHGIWSHLTFEDVQAGKHPDMREHHIAQVSFRKRWIDLGKHITAVSDFIADQMRLQWGFEVDRVINNGVDTERYQPLPRTHYLGDRPLIIHGVNDRGNVNKGWDHIDLLERSLDAYVFSLDEAYSRFLMFSDRQWQKHEILSQADLVVHPSGYEGNSMFVAEALSSGAPLVCYDVGFAYWMGRNLTWADRVGAIMPRVTRSPETTLAWTRHVLDSLSSDAERATVRANSRRIAEWHLDISRFVAEWRSYVEEIENGK